MLGDQKKHHPKRYVGSHPDTPDDASQGMLAPLLKACHSCARRACQASFLRQDGLPGELLNNSLFRVVEQLEGGRHVDGIMSVPEPLSGDSCF